MKNEKEFKEAAKRLLELVDAEARGEISEKELLKEWKIFMRLGNEYLQSLREKLN